MKDVAEHPVAVKQLESRLLEYGDILLEKSGGGPTQPVGRVALFNIQDGEYSFSNFTARIRIIDERIDSFYVWLCLNYLYQTGRTEALQKQTSGIRNLDNPAYQRLQIPLPPLDVQREIVAEIEGYQKVIDGARAVVNNYQPHIPIRPDWPLFELGEVCSFSSGGTPAKTNESYWNGDIPWVSAKDLKVDQIYDAQLHVSQGAIAETATQLAQPGSLLILVRGMGLANGVPICEVMTPCAFNQDVKAIQPDADVVIARFLAFILRQQDDQFRKMLETAAHGTLKINSDDLRQVRIPLPPLAVQRAIAAEIEAEQALVAANRELIERFEKKIQDTLARVWGEDATAEADLESANGFRDHGPGVAAGALAGGSIVAGSSKAR